MNHAEKMKNRRDLDRIEAAKEGIKHAVTYERPVKIHLAVLTGALVILWFWFQEWWLIKQTIILGSLIIAAEMINTALEELADMIQPEKDPRIKKVKDLGAGVTLLFVIIGVVITLVDILLLLW